MPSHILVVEDERDLQRVLTYNFKQAGFDVVSAPDGETALRAVREERFDLVLLDLMLPDADGFELCREIRELSDVASSWCRPAGPRPTRSVRSTWAPTTT